MGRYCPLFGDIYRCNSDCTAHRWKRELSAEFVLLKILGSGDDAIEQKESPGYDTLACNIFFLQGTLACNRKLTKTNHEQELLKFDVNFLY